MNLKYFIRFFIFIFLLILLLFFLSKIITNNEFPIEKDIFQAFYSEKENSLDGVYIGPSVVYTTFIPTRAFYTEGITVLNLSAAAMSPTHIKYLIEETLKTQKPKFIAIEAGFLVNIFGDDDTLQCHRSLVYMKNSQTKLKMIFDFVNFKNLTYIEAIEYIFPVVRFKENWKNIRIKDLKHNQRNRKGMLYQEEWFAKDNNSCTYTNIKNEMDVSPETKKIQALNILLDYTDTISVPVIFINTPLPIHILNNGKYKQKRIEELNKILSNRGYILINNAELSIIKKINLTNSDYTDCNHMNFYGAVKYTDYIAHLLKNRFNLTDKRTDKNYSSWMKIHGEYINEIEKEYNIDITN